MVVGGVTVFAKRTTAKFKIPWAYNAPAAIIRPSLCTDIACNRPLRGDPFHVPDVAKSLSTAPVSSRRITIGSGESPSLIPLIKMLLSTATNTSSPKTSRLLAGKYLQPCGPHAASKAPDCVRQTTMGLCWVLGAGPPYVPTATRFPFGRIAIALSRGSPLNSSMR